jgi:hypothetical protein
MLEMQVEREPLTKTTDATFWQATGNEAKKAPLGIFGNPGISF